ncbi:glycosyltransferase family 4 protein [Sphingomonas arantia]|uniref:Glycosyltransferase family 4 protein n=1 Tax=Sphingomonas arantia TaxID=1460676 RepID=A0ABW4TU71_9SPHN
MIAPPDGPFHLCIVGGTPTSRGGVEIFTERADAAVALCRPDWRLTTLPAQTAFLRPARFPGFLRALATFVRAARRDRVDLLWLQACNLPDLTYLLLARLLRVRVLVTPHLGANSQLQRTAPLRHILRHLLARADRLALLFDGQDREIALPPHVPRSVIRTLLPRGALRPAAPMPDRGPAIRLIHAARLSEGKGSFRFVALCAELKRRGLPFIAQLVGTADEPTTARLRADIAAADLGPAFTWAGWMAEAPLLEQLRAADVLVHLSVLDSYPLIVLEAMASGALPLVTDMAGMAAMVAHGDGHVVPDDNAVTAAADWLWAQDPVALRRRGVALGHRVRTDYDWPACVATLADAIALMPARRG